METDNKTTIINRIIQGDDLPVLSPLAIQLVELASDDEASASDLAAVIEKDPSLATRLLKMVGSAFYRGASPPATVTRAVVRLGFKRVRIMALTLSLRQTFALEDDKGEDKAADGGMDYQLFWKTSLYRALVAQDFAKAIDTADPDESFVAGLISEIGMLMLYQVCQKEKRDTFPGKELSLQRILEWETTHLGVQHREVGRIVLQQWKFPETLVQTQLYDGTKALDPDSPALCGVVELARQATEIAYEHTADLHRLHRMAQHYLHLEPETVTTILVTAFSRVEELAKHLQIDVDAHIDMLNVMEKANQALARMGNAIADASQNRQSQRVSETGPQQPHPHSTEDVLQNTLDAVAHEIRNPLLAIGGFAKRLAEEGKNVDEKTKYAKIIVDESSRLEDVLQDMMAYCQAYEPQLEATDIILLVDNLLAEMQERFVKRKGTVHRQFPEPPVLLSLDQEKIGEALSRLMELAFITTKQAGGTVKVSIDSRQKKDQCVIAIKDNGIPLSKETQDALLDGNLTAKTLGKGLKLSLARKIIEAHHGRIALHVEEGEGNTLSVSLPGR